ncbi:hypothetical protein R5R35_013516 [Gryllus longicercus]|uniref:Proton-coupled folate transporter n=2 Tax=Gryllus longicercus TaxID=2509291 RepID=A0AAN9YXC8_9ORTH
MAQQRTDFESSYNAISTDENERKSWYYYIPVTIEPAVFLFCFGSTLCNTVTTNLFLVHTCENSLGFNHSVCQRLTDKTYNNSHELETEVQRVVTYFTLGKTLIEGIIPALLSFYIGPWSDVNGRKPIIMWPMLGFTLSYMILLFESLFPKLPVVVLMLSSLPAALTGGFISFISGIYSYISDVSKSDKRTLRLGMVEVALFGGLLGGSVAVSYIYNAAGQWGYIAVYATSVFCCILAWLFCCIFVQESVVNGESEYPCCCVSTGLFKNNFFAEMIGFCIEKRPDHNRAIIFILLIVMGTCIGTFEGELSVLFLFTREKFGWDLHKYSIFAAVAMAINIVGLFFGTHILGPCLRLSPAVASAFGFFMKLLAAVVTALSPAYWYMYVGVVVSLPGACVGPWVRSILSTSVPKADIGKVFSIVASVESLVPIAAGPVYTLLYNGTIQSFPGAFFLLSAGLFAVDVLLLLGVVVLQRRQDSNQYLHSALIQEDDNHQ